MAALSSRSVARLSQNLHRISLTRGPKVNHVYAALLHNSYTLNAGIFNYGEEEEGETFLTNFSEAHTCITKQQDLPKETIERQQKDLEEQVIKYAAAKEYRRVLEQEQQHRKHIERGLKKTSIVKEIKWYDAVLVPGYYENKHKNQLKTIREEDVLIKKSLYTKTDAIERECMKETTLHSEVSMSVDSPLVDPGIDKSDTLKNMVVLENIKPESYNEKQQHSHIEDEFMIVQSDVLIASDIVLPHSEDHGAKQDSYKGNTENLCENKESDAVQNESFKDSSAKTECLNAENHIEQDQLDLKEVNSREILFENESEEYFECLTKENIQQIEENLSEAGTEIIDNTRVIQEIDESDKSTSSLAHIPDDNDEYFDCLTDIPKTQLASFEDAEQVSTTSVTVDQEEIDIKVPSVSDDYPPEVFKDELGEPCHTVPQEEKLFTLQTENNEEPSISKQIVDRIEQGILVECTFEADVITDKLSTVNTDTDSLTLSNEELRKMLHKTPEVSTVKIDPDPDSITLTSEELLKMLHKTPEIAQNTHDVEHSTILQTKSETEIKTPINVTPLIRIQDLGVWNLDQGTMGATGTRDIEEMHIQKIDIGISEDTGIRVMVEMNHNQIPEGSADVQVGTLIGVIAPEGEDWKTIEIPKIESAAPAAAPTAAPVSVAAPTPAAAPVAAWVPVIHGNFGPSVRLLLEQYGLTPEQVPASGRNNIVLKGDVLKHIKSLGLQPLPVQQVPPPSVDKPAAAVVTPAPAPVPTVPSGPVAPPLPGVSEDGWDDIEVTNMRRTIAKRLSQSKGGIAHSYGTMDCRADALLALRKQLKAEGIKTSVNDFIIKAVAVALQHCPEMNAVWKGDQLHLLNEVDISVAVATPAGLITPIVKDADALGVEEINATVKELASRAKINKLKPEEFMGGTFTISNLGMFGISEFSAIINPPQCGILAVGGSRLTLGESGSPETRMSATLSYDRAAIDDDTAAIFLETLKDLLEEPTTILMGARSRNVNHPLAALL